MRSSSVWLLLGLASPFALTAGASCGDPFSADSAPPDGGAAGTTLTGTGTGQGGTAGSGASGTGGEGAGGLEDGGTAGGDAATGGASADAAVCDTCLEWSNRCIYGSASCTLDKVCPGTSLLLASDLKSCACQACTAACSPCPENVPTPTCRLCMKNAADGLCVVERDDCADDYPDG